MHLAGRALASAGGLAVVEIEKLVAEYVLGPLASQAVESPAVTGPFEVVVLLGSFDMTKASKPRPMQEGHSHLASQDVDPLGSRQMDCQNVLDRGLARPLHGNLCRHGSFHLHTALKAVLSHAQRWKQKSWRCHSSLPPPLREGHGPHQNRPMVRLQMAGAEVVKSAAAVALAALVAQ